MGGTFSRRKDAKSKSQKMAKGGTITATDRAVLDLKNSRDRLTKYRSKLAIDSTKLAVRAKDLHSQGNTSYALQLLRLRKYKLQEAERVDDQLLTVLRLVEKISEKQNEQEVVVAMKRGKDALQLLHDQMGIDDVLELMDEIRDQDEVEKRINEVLGWEGLRMVEEMDEKDILLELGQLEDEARLEVDATLITETAHLGLPTIPVAPLPKLEYSKMTESRKENVAVAS